ncbi:hypothetical protein [Specibacter cremeus]|uniref:hypothetical protein n=1 Tax=Specibacter cremeus TaxID=1629051 RepID=UPI0013DDDABC|nr:hypothetical protein [Specibacter cremeus]
MAHSSHKRQKGCAICSPHKNSRNGDAARTPLRVLRRLGVTRRWSRNDPSDAPGSEEE